MGFADDHPDYEARFEAMADYADYARKRDKENPPAERGIGSPHSSPRTASAGPTAHDELAAGRPRSASAYRCAPRFCRFCGATPQEAGEVCNRDGMAGPHSYEDCGELRCG